MTAPLPARDPFERATLQRERILRAARRCFVRRGFHAASMADIAEAAEMSPGLIYRYFPGKEAIVQAIVQRELEEARRILDRVGSTGDVAGSILEVFERWTRGDDEEVNAALFLEMAAASTRDEGLGEAMRAADAEIRCRLAGVLERSGATEEEPPAVRAWRATMLQCLVEGLLVRAVRQPDLDRALLRESLAAALAALKAWPEPAAGGAPLRPTAR